MWADCSENELTSSSVTRLPDLRGKRATASPKRLFHRGEPHAGLAWVPRAVIHTLNMTSATRLYAAQIDKINSIPAPAERIAPACGLRKNNTTLTTIRFKHREPRL